MYKIHICVLMLKHICFIHLENDCSYFSKCRIEALKRPCGDKSILLQGKALILASLVAHVPLCSCRSILCTPHNFTKSYSGVGAGGRRHSTPTRTKSSHISRTVECQSLTKGVAMEWRGCKQPERGVEYLLSSRELLVGCL